MLSRLLRPARFVPLLVLAVTVAYHHAPSAAFVFDDQGAILTNPTIRTLDPATVLSPPYAGLPVTGRPLTNLSFALNYAAGGLSGAGYHVTNVVLHALAGLLLYALLRHTLRLVREPRCPGETLAGMTALIWSTHPLLTSAVTYASQRAEILGSIAILLALYALARGAGSALPRPWYVLAVAAAWLGTGCKEIVAAVPLLALAFDRLFLAGSWAEVRRQRGWVHGWLIASWIPLLWLITHTENRGGTWGPEAGYSWLEYARLQSHAVWRYIRLTLWPAPLVFDYGRDLPVPPWRTVILPASVPIAALGLTGLGLVRGRSWAFPALLFFAVLAPSSSVIPLADPVFEHRAYLVSAVVILFVLLLVHRWFPRLGIACSAPLVVVTTILTIARNGDYQSPVGLWADTVAKVPTNARALGNLGEVLLRADRADEAIPHFIAAQQAAPHLPLPPHNLANALDLAGRRAEAIPWYREALRLQPRNVRARTNLASGLAAEGQVDEALNEYERVINDAPEFYDARVRYGTALLRANRPEAAAEQFAVAIALRSEAAEAHAGHGEALARSGQLSDAVLSFRQAVHLDPQHVPAWNNLGNALLLSGQADEAVITFQRSLSLREDAVTRTNLGYALLLARRPDEARRAFEQALELAPTYAPAQQGLARLRP